MKYSGFYFWMFKGSMKQVLAKKYDKAYAQSIMKQSKAVYRQLVEGADDIGDDNPMAYNALFTLAFVAPYVASEKKIPPETVQEMMRRSLYHIKWYFARTDLNTDKGKAENKKEHCEVREMVHARKKKSSIRVIQGGLRRPAVRGRVLLPDHPLSHLRVRGKSWAFAS